MTRHLVHSLFVVVLLASLGVAPGIAHAQEQTTGAEDEGWITVRPGDTLFSIARRYDVAVSDLRAWNDLQDSSIRAGMRLRIAPVEEPDRPVEEESPAVEVDAAPEQPAVEAATGSVSPLGGGMVAVTIGSGETLFSLANRFALSADSLQSLNPGLPEALESGMVIIVPEDRVASTRTVRRGDTLFSIARDEGVSVDRLRSLNNLSGSSIRVGQRLTVPAATISSDAGIRLASAGQFSIRPYPEALEGRTLSTGRDYDADAFLIGHPSLPPGSIVLVESGAGSHAFAEVIEKAPARRPAFIEGSRKLFEVLSLESGDVVTLYRVR